MLSARKAPGTGPGPHVSPTGARVVAGLAFVVLMIAGCSPTKPSGNLEEQVLVGAQHVCPGPHREVTDRERAQTWGSLPLFGPTGGVSRVFQVHFLVPSLQSKSGN